MSRWGNKKSPSDDGRGGKSFVEIQHQIVREAICKTIYVVIRL